MADIPKVAYYRGELIVSEWYDEIDCYYKYKTDKGTLFMVALSEIVNGNFPYTYPDVSTYPLSSGSACVPFNDWFTVGYATGTSSIAPIPELSKNNCSWCRCRLFPEDRWCPACGGPIYD